MMGTSEGTRAADRARREPTASGAAGSRRSGRARWRPYTAAAVAVGVVFGFSALIGAHVRAGRTSQVTPPAGVPSEAPLAIPMTPSVPVTLTVYEDLRSPQSKAFAARYAGTFAALLATGQVRIDYRLVTPVDAKYGGRGSLTAANAAACARDQGPAQFQDFVQQLWEKQPPVSVDTFADAGYLEKLGRKVHKLDASTFVPCVHSSDHLGWVLASQRQYAAARLGGVPVMQINGRTVDPAKDALTPEALAGLVRQAADAAARQYAASAAPSAPVSTAASGPGSPAPAAAPSGPAAASGRPSASPSPSAS